MACPGLLIKLYILPVSVSSCLSDVLTSWREDGFVTFMLVGHHFISFAAFGADSVASPVIPATNELIMSDQLSIKYSKEVRYAVLNIQRTTNSNKILTSRSRMRARCRSNGSARNTRQEGSEKTDNPSVPAVQQAFTMARHRARERNASDRSSRALLFLAVRSGLFSRVPFVHSELTHFGLAEWTQNTRIS